MLSQNFFIKTISIQEAVERLRSYGMSMTVQKLKAGAEQGVYPFVDVVNMKNYSYCVYEKLFDEWCLKRGVEPTATESA